MADDDDLDEGDDEESTEEEGEGVDEESADMLDKQVKKGKERKFVVIYKGAQIKKLIVFRKGTYKSKIQQARKDGFRGVPVCGLVKGAGMELVFRVAGTKQVAQEMGVDDIITEAPIKTNLLKAFLSDNDLKRKPSFEIVSSVAALQGKEQPGGPKGAGPRTA